MPRLDNRRKLDNFKKEMIRRCPAGDVWRLPAVFDVSSRQIFRIRNGTRGMPQQNGRGARPWEITERELVEKWYARYLAKGEAARQRALEKISNDEALTIEPTPDEALSRELDKVDTAFGLFKGAVGYKPKPAAPPAAPTAPATAKSQSSQPGVFYDRR